jgi:hypothetical protein
MLFPPTVVVPCIAHVKARFSQLPKPLTILLLATRHGYFGATQPTEMWFGANRFRPLRPC